MGVVVMKQETAFLSRGYPYMTAMLYVYCDKCGSFDIKTDRGLWRRLLIFGSCGLAAVVALKLTRSWLDNLWWFLLGLAAIILFLRLVWGYSYYRCRKCGITPITEYNTLQYPSDMSIVNVPDESAAKFYLGGWPDLCDLGEQLKPPWTKGVGL
jgi:hypothetical protein